MLLETAVLCQHKLGMGRRPAWCSVWVAVHLLAMPALTEEIDLNGLEEQAIHRAVEAVAPSVVRIETIGGVERSGEVLLGEGPTTGLVIGADGWVISSAFNFLRQPASILVTLPNEKRVAAQIVARDHSRMVVLLKANVAQPLPVPEAAPHADLTVGQWTVAVGRAFDVKEPNVSIGVLSAKSRIWGKAVQTDAKVSPSNYGGALIDIRGRVIGVLVPLSPDAQGEVAGAEWYDSGIGFAVPLTDIQQRLPNLQSGRDVYPGLLGITLRDEDIFSSPAAIAAVQVNSPAFEAGLRTGDTIAALDGQPIVTQAQLKHLLGPRDAGDKVQVVVTRGTKRIETTVNLVDKLLPYEHPFVGLLPLRARPADSGGTGVRFVFPDSGAAHAGLRAGDKIVSLDGKQIPDPDALRVEIANRQPEQVVALGLERGRDKLAIDVKLSRLPTSVPTTLPIATSPDPLGTAAPATTGIVEIKIAEEPNSCVALIPDNYDPRKSYGLVVHLPSPGEFDREAFSQLWRARTAQQDLIVLAPQAAQPDGWQPTEVEVIRKTMDQVLNNYAVDRNRVVTYGYQASGTMALLVAFRHRDLVRGVAVNDAGPPRQLRLPDNDPIERLAVFLLVASESKVLERMDAAAKLLSERKFPVTAKKTNGPPRQLNADELAEFLRWIDCLDRI